MFCPRLVRAILEKILLTECDLFLVMTNFGDFLSSVPRDRHLTDRFICASRWKLSYIIIMPYFAEKVP